MTAVFWLALGLFSLVVAALTGGLISMAQGGTSDAKHATHYMYARVGLQALALVLVLTFVYALS